ncbi:hypothetical protein HAX54_021868 [Datura stramonium]|uniref:Uncharacterized protein n=1 Tax=Datura stramonium TaxID=4076 RepID=A0ABS8UUJ9_DATST|nr:hypothetical protein [Datura stramonium]
MSHIEGSTQLKGNQIDDGVPSNVEGLITSPAFVWTTLTVEQIQSDGPIVNPIHKRSVEDRLHNTKVGGSRIRIMQVKVYLFKAEFTKYVKEIHYWMNQILRAPLVIKGMNSKKYS